MKKNAWRKRIILAVTTGAAAMFSFGGCLGLNVENLLRLGGAYSGSASVLEPGAFPALDLLPDGAPSPAGH